MACSCTELLADLKVKYDLILELVNTILGMLPRQVGGGDDARIKKPKRKKKKKAIIYDEFQEIIAIIAMSEILE